MRKKLAILLVMVMVLTLGTTALAAKSNTGSITINSAENVSVKNKTFNAYKVLNLKSYNEEKGTYVYTVPEELKQFYKDHFQSIKDEGDFSAQVVNAITQLKGQELFTFAQAVLDAAKKADISPMTATGASEATTVTIDNLELGYYVVEDAGSEKPISALILETTNPNVNVTVKADKPDIDKVIVEGESTIDKNNASIGDKVNFKITSKVPDMTGYNKYYFIVTDTMSKGLTFNNDISIKIGGNVLIEGSGYMLTTTTNEKAETSFEIVFKNFVNQTPGDAIVIEYSANINEKAVIGTNGNLNTAKLEYSNNPNVKDEGQAGNPDKPKDKGILGTTPNEVTYTYVTGIQITKTDEEKNRLQGAEFRIKGEKLNHVLVKRDVYEEALDGTFYKLKNGTYTETIPTEDTKDQYENTEIKYTLKQEVVVEKKSESVDTKGIVGNDGVLRFDGLAAGEYTITELKAPDGYNLLRKPIDVKINWTALADNTTECKWMATVDGNTATVQDGIIKLDVVNKAGSELPSTGGIGTTIFYVFGSILMVFSVVVLIAKKRMSGYK